jgi:hypothetical protein
MELDEIQQIWNVQNKQSLYMINDLALHDRIRSEKKRAGHITNVSELLSIIANGIAGSFILGVNLLNERSNVFLYALALWMFITVFYSLNSRIRRAKANHQFDRSIQSDLDYAISTATYQVRLSQLMRLNIIPIGTFILLSFWEGGKSIWLILGAIFFFVLSYLASGWEHNIYKARRHELEALKNKLLSA